VLGSEISWAQGSSKTSRRAPSGWLDLGGRAAAIARSIWNTRAVDVHLTTARLLLRRFDVSDADALLALDSDPLVRHFVEDGEVPTPESARETIEHWLAHYARNDLYGFWAAIERASGQFIGWFHFRPHGDNAADEPELGYRLVSSSWGKGYATEGSRALIDHGFTSGRVQRVVAETMVVHKASRRVMEKVGMRLVRTFVADWPVRIPGDEEGDVEYAITRAEWLQLQR
jgi:RimJ/RimL family protein N-acetyltransferase